MNYTLCMVLVAGLAACGKGDGKGGGGGGGESCPAFAVTVDGAAVPGLTHGHAVTMESGGNKMLTVSVFNTDKVTCEELLKSSRAVNEGEISVRVFTGGMTGVGIESWTQGGGTVQVVKDAGKEGEPVELCVPKPIEFSPTIGAYKGKKVSIVGKAVGPYCGVNKI